MLRRRLSQGIEGPVEGVPVRAEALAPECGDPLPHHPSHSDPGTFSGFFCLYGHCSTPARAGAAATGRPQAINPFSCCPGIESAHEKGGGEGQIGYYRRNHFVPVPEAGSLTELNALGVLNRFGRLLEPLDSPLPEVGLAAALLAAERSGPPYPAELVEIFAKDGADPDPGDDDFPWLATITPEQHLARLLAREGSWCRPVCSWPTGAGRQHCRNRSPRSDDVHRCEDVLHGQRRGVDPGPQGPAVGAEAFRDGGGGPEPGRDGDLR
ncbi:hypothetical protein ABT354_32940 [Streptomyces sp. NPDC000594]|uniref:hypothetical protein n=1 Tax=Streptomyces sp. NPDC000594 TaxID=3154261 RepID=UPI00331676B8